MAKRGRPSKPPELKVIEGNPGKRAIPKTPKPKAIGSLKAPGMLRVDAVEYWNYYAPELARLKLLTHNDRDMFAVLCNELAGYVEAADQVRAGGAVIEVQSTYQTIVKRNPWLDVRNRCLDNIMKLGARFGFSPVDRISLARPQGDGNEDERFLFGT